MYLIQLPDKIDKKFCGHVLSLKFYQGFETISVYNHSQLLSSYHQKLMRTLDLRLQKAGKYSIGQSSVRLVSDIRRLAESKLLSRFGSYL